MYSKCTRTDVYTILNLQRLQEIPNETAKDSQALLGNQCSLHSTFISAPLKERKSPDKSEMYICYTPKTEMQQIQRKRVALLVMTNGTYLLDTITILMKK